MPPFVHHIPDMAILHSLPRTAAPRRHLARPAYVAVGLPPEYASPPPSVVLPVAAPPAFATPAAGVVASLDLRAPLPPLPAAEPPPPFATLIFPFRSLVLIPAAAAEAPPSRAVEPPPPLARAPEAGVEPEPLLPPAAEEATSSPTTEPPEPSAMCGMAAAGARGVRCSSGDGGAGAGGGNCRLEFETYSRLS